VTLRVGGRGSNRDERKEHTGDGKKSGLGPDPVTGTQEVLEPPRFQDVAMAGGWFADHPERIVK